MSDQYYPFYVGDYLRDTGDLSLLEHGAYHIMLHHYYTMGGLPADRQKLYRICRAFTPDEQKAIDDITKRYFSENGDGNIKNRKAEEVLAERKEFVQKQSARGKAGAEARWSKQALLAPMPAPMLKQRRKTSLPSPPPSPLLPPINIEEDTNVSSSQVNKVDRETGEHVQKDVQDVPNEHFDQFWKAYPKRVAKGRALAAWKKIKKPAETLKLILEALDWQKLSHQWTKNNGEFIPNPASYLNAQAWLDEQEDATDAFERFVRNGT